MGLEIERKFLVARLEGLVVAEVEVGSEEASRDFSPPPWLGQEIAEDPGYANRRLAVDGHPAA